MLFPPSTSTITLSIQIKLCRTGKLAKHRKIGCNFRTSEIKSALSGNGALITMHTAMQTTTYAFEFLKKLPVSDFIRWYIIISAFYFNQLPFPIIPLSYICYLITNFVYNLNKTN